MRFKGQLLLPDEPGPGLRVDLDVAEHHLAVEADGGGLGAWPLEVVDVERNGDLFALTVAGEVLQFLADDTIAFAYSGVPTIEKVSGRSRARSGFRSMFNRIWNGPEKAETPSVPEPAPVESEEPSRITAEPEIVEAALRAVDVVKPEAEIVEAEPRAVDVVEPVELPPATTEVEEVGELPALAADPGCPAIRSDGRRCESPILTSSGYCYPHDPKRVFEDKYQAAQEARTQLKRDATARLNRVYGRLDKAMRQVESGDLDPETAMAMAQLARTMCAILDLNEPPGAESGTKTA